MKGTKNYIVSILCVLVSIMFTSCNKTNWRENFRERSKDPFGTYIIQKEASTLFKNNEIELLKKHIDDYFFDIYYDYQPEYANYVCIKSKAYKLYSDSSMKLLQYVENGNDIFLSLNSFPSTLEEELKFSTENLDKDAYSVSDLKSLKGSLYLVNNNFEQTTFKFDRNLRRNYFKDYDSTNTVILGTQNINGKHEANFIKIKHGKGNVFLHTQPIAFTNYNLLKGNQNYAAQVFSYLPDRKVLWDPHIRSSKIRNNNDDDTSALSFFMQHDSLRWSLYVAFLALLFYMTVNSRRKQRAIPEVKRLKNSTQDFTHTIANLYLKERNHKSIVTKKITYFLERIRSQYHLETRKIDDNFIEKLASKSGNTVHTTKYLMNTIIGLNKKSMCTQDELVRLNTLIENFLEHK